MSEKIESIKKNTVRMILNKEITLEKKDFVKITVLEALDNLSYLNSQKYERYLKEIIIRNMVNSAWKDFEPFYNSLVTVEMNIDWEVAWYKFVRNFFI